MERWLILGEDARMKELAKALQMSHRTVYFKHTSTWNNTINAIILDFCPTHIVLPIQPLIIEVALLLGVKHVQFFAGKLNEEWQQLLSKQQVVYYLENETFIWRNAMLTAEGFVKWFYDQGTSLRGKKFIVTGFGRVAKSIAASLRGLGAHIIIAVRSKSQVEEAKLTGYETIYLQPVFMKAADGLINTIPAQWLTQPFNEVLTMPIYDVASAPGCLYYVSRSNYEQLLALPGKYFPQDAAQLLQQSILEACAC